MLNDEAATEQQLNRLCGNENAFSYTRVPRRRTHVEVTPGGIAAVLEVEREGAGMSREVPRMNAGQGRNGTAIHVKDALANRVDDVESDQDQKAAEGEEAAAISDSDDESDDDEFHDSESNPLEESDSDDDFVNLEFEELINSEGPQGMLQLMLQEQTDGIMTEENSFGDDYAEWIKWSSDEKKNRLSKGESAHNVGTVLLQQHKPDRDSVIPAILQTTQVRTDELDRKSDERQGHGVDGHQKKG
ncbi:unnamed protein product [Sphagnum troendelagicum]|uniref:Uncharacterized protein n=1 Tax=Sphagnum troendelagicum TaxID=128251 RepID=A0ABP0T971_9BRYO